MSSFNFNGIILELFKRKKEQNQSYSLRALARDMKLSPSYMSRVLRGEKTLTPQRLKKLFRILDVDIETQAKLKSLFVINKMGSDYKNLVQIKNEDSHLRFKKLPQSKLSILTKWYYVPVLELMTTSGFDLSAGEISRRLGISKYMVQESVEALLKLNILEKSENKITRSNSHIRLDSSVSKPEIRQYHSAMINKANEELRKVDDESFSLRLITGITIGANVEKLEMAKSILNDAIHKASKILKDPMATEVYQINLQLFPLSKR